jgi:glutamate synthase (NADPH/NADH) large chain/glutamate synthase (ferredoxin)
MTTAAEIQHLQQHGLYSSGNEHDACGLGVVAHIKGIGESKQGDVTYTVVMKLDRQDERLRWNMTASVAIEPR